MPRILTVMLTALLLLPNVSNAGWGEVLDAAQGVDKLIIDRSAPPAEDEAPPPKQEPERSSPRAANEDAHFIQPDDYFVSTEELGEHTYIYVTLAKMLTPPSGASKGEGEFMTVVEGRNIWTQYVWKTRIAQRNEFKLGLHVIAFNDNNQNEVYQAPVKKESARGGAWFYAKITDLSDIYKGYVTVSGNYKVGLKNLRVITR